MDPQRWKQITSIFQVAARLAPHARTSYIREACGSDPSLCSEVESLIASHARASSVLDPNALEPVLASAIDASGDAPLHGRVGRYRIIRRIASGGMGVIYEAEQDSPRRRVALKLLHAGVLPDERSIHLFAREVRALARLAHPSIAAIHDAGATADGRPYFAMELVSGERLDDHVRSRSVPLSGRLEIFRRICDAIAYAHQRGVVHRDLKPANILVCAGDGDHATDGSTIKILDFGIARVADADMGESRSISAGAIQGTLPYMSPEQARGDPERIDLRTDVYSLGVILYELLTDRVPHDVPAASIPEAVRVICEDPVPRPRALRRAIPADLEIILLKALEKEPNRRYASVADLGRDVARFQRGEPIEARRAGTGYVLRRLMARHKTQTFLAASVILALILGAAVSTTYWREARGRLAEATRQRLIASSSGALPEDPALALLLAIEAARRGQDRTSNDALLAAMRDLREVRTLPAASSPVGCAVFDPGGRLVAAACDDGIVRVWDWQAAGSSPLELRGHAGAVLAVDFHPTAGTLLSTGADGTARLWNVATMREEARIEVSDDPVTCARYAPDGATFATGSAGGGAAIWTARGVHVLRLAGHRAAVNAISFHPDGGSLVTVSADSTARIWDAASGEERRLPAAHLPLHAASFSPDGSTIAATTSDHYAEDHNAWIWDAATGREVAILRGHEDSVGAVAASPDGRWIVTGGADNTIRIWDVRSAVEVARLRGHGGWIRSLRFSPDGLRVLSASQDGTARVWDARIRPRRALMEGEQLEGAPSLIREGLRLTRTRDATVVWDAVSGERPESIAVLHGAEARGIRSLALDHARTRAASWCDESPVVLIWNLVTGHVERRLEGHTRNPCSARFTPDDRIVATSSADGSVRTWEAATGNAIHVLRGHDDIVENVTISPDGRRLATASNDRTARVWDLASGAPVCVMRGHENTVHIACFSEDSRLVITASSDATARIWDAATGQERVVLRGHPGGLTTARLSPDNRHAVTTAWDATVRLWDAESGRELATLAADVYLYVAFTPSGDEVRLANWDKPPQRWPVDILSLAVSRAPRDLTPEERRRFEIEDGADRR